MSSEIQETLAPFQITRERKVVLPIALLLSIVGAIALAYARLAVAADNVQRNTDEIKAIKTDQQIQREILIRIDENVKDLRRAQRRGNGE